jgi:hypothetical protein
MPTGGETGGEWISDPHDGEANSGVTATVDIGDSACTEANVRCFALTSDELLIAARWSGTGVVWQQE